MNAAQEIANNATRMGHDTITTAVGASLVTGATWLALCFWCAEDYPEGEHDSHRVAGCCGRCSYKGEDSFIVRAP